jgi:hypothetical protein
MESTLRELIMLYNRLSLRNLHLTLSPTVIATVINISLLSQNSAVVILLTKIFDFAFANDELNGQMFMRTVRVLHQGVYLHCYVVCKREENVLHIEMIIHEPRNR